MIPCVWLPYGFECKSMHQRKPLKQELGDCDSRHWRKGVGSLLLGAFGATAGPQGRFEPQRLSADCSSVFRFY